MVARLRVQVPVGEGDIEAEESRKDHHRSGEQEGRQKEQRLLAGFPAGQDLHGAQRDAPQQKHIQKRAPISQAGRENAG